MGLALFTEATGALSMERRHRAPSLQSVDAEHLLDWVLEARAKKVNSESLCAPRNQLEKREREKERKNDTGSPSSDEAGSAALFSKGAFIP